MNWEALLGYEPAMTKLVRDMGDPALAHVRFVVDNEEQDKSVILWAVRKTFESGHSLPPDLGLALCDLLEAKKPANRPAPTDTQKIRDQAQAELYAEFLGCLRVKLVMAGHPRFAEKAAEDLCMRTGAGMTVGTTTFKKFCSVHRLAILCGEVREIHRMLADGIVTIEGDYQKWIKAMRPEFKETTRPCRERLEYMFK